ncbi:MAG: hypothetical protein ABIK62_03760 [candidate division WOR-3 bacterium]
MARDPIRSERKYRRKFDEQHVAKQLRLAREDMQDAYASAQAELSNCEEVTREILGEYNVPSISYPFYLNFARQVWKARRRFTGETLKTEVQILVDKWKARRLDESVLDEIRSRVFTISKPGRRTNPGEAFAS